MCNEVRLNFSRVGFFGSFGGSYNTYTFMIKKCTLLLLFPGMCRWHLEIYHSCSNLWNVFVHSALIRMNNSVWTVDLFNTFEYFWLLICCFLAFCSLGSNQISDEGAHTVAAALQVNQSLQELKWVQPFHSYTSLKVYTVSVVPRYVLKFIGKVCRWHLELYHVYSNL